MGVRGDRVAERRSNFKGFGVFLDAVGAVVLRNAENVRDEVQVLDAGQMFVKIRVVWNVSGQRFTQDGFFLNGVPVDADFPFVEV